MLIKRDHEIWTNNSNISWSDWRHSILKKYNSKPVRENIEIDNIMY